MALLGRIDDGYREAGLPGDDDDGYREAGLHSDDRLP